MSKKCLFHDLSINICIIPENPLLNRKESWDKTIESEFDNDMISPGRINYLYYQIEQHKRLNDFISIISKDNEIENIQLIHKTSYSGFPYQLLFEFVDNNEKIEISYDGLVLFFTKKIKDEIEDFDELLKITNSQLSYRNTCYYITRKINPESYKISTPFWDATYINIEDLGFKTNTDYPVFELICDDENFITMTNLGDKQIAEKGRKYIICLGENKKVIRDRICIDKILQEDFEYLQKYMDFINKDIIEKNELIINSLQDMPNNILSFFKRTKKWKSLKNIPNQLLKYECLLPKYESYMDKFNTFIEYRLAYINTPIVIWSSKKEKDDQENQQRQVSHFFQITYEKGKLNIKDSKPIKPYYANAYSIIMRSFKNIKKNMINARSNLNDSITIYSTNFGFDALWIAIFALLITIIPINIVTKTIIEWLKTIN